MMTIEQLRAKVQQQERMHEQRRWRQWTKVCVLWEQCCQIERLDPMAPSITFSPDNPYLAALEETRTTYLQLAV